MNYFRLVIKLIFLPFILLYESFFGDFRKTRKRGLLILSSLLMVIWFSVLILISYALFPDFLQYILPIALPIALILTGISEILVQLGFMKNIEFLEKKSYSEWYVDYWPLGQIWKFLIGKKAAVNFTHFVISQNVLGISIGIVFILIGFYIFFF